MDFTNKLDELKNLLSDLNLRIREGSLGLIVEDIENDNSYVCYENKLDSATLTDIKPTRLVIFE